MTHRTLAAEVDAVKAHITGLRRQYPTLDPDEVFRRVYDLEAGVLKVPPWRFHATIVADEPNRQAMRQWITAYNKRLNSLVSHVKATEIAGSGRKQRVLAELERARLLPGAKWRGIPQRGTGSKYAWVPERATALVDYLAPRLDGANLYVAVARLLAVASGERITAPMVKDRVLRHTGNK